MIGNSGYRLCHMVKCTDGSHIISGGRHEACSGAYAFLFWNRNDASFVHSGDIIDFDLYHRVSDAGILSVLLLIFYETKKRTCQTTCPQHSVPIMLFQLSQNVSKKYIHTSS